MRHDSSETPKVVLRSTLAYLEREAARRAEGRHAGMMRLQDEELAALIEVLRRETEVPEARGLHKGEGARDRKDKAA